jgi:Trk K+ transport system NAD-binding subunit
MALGASPFSELSTLLSPRRGDRGLVLIGIERGGDLYLNPRDDMILQEGDALIVIARVRPALEKVPSPYMGVS